MDMENLEKVRAELNRYEHPLFNFSAESCQNGVRVTVTLKPELGLNLHDYHFVVSDRELAAQKFAWDFERQLFNYLHDYLVEMFTLTPETLT